MTSIPPLFGKSVARAQSLQRLVGLTALLGIAGLAQGLETTFDGSSNAVPDGVIVQLESGNEVTVPTSNMTQGLPSGNTFTLKGKLPSGTPTAPKLPIEAGSVIFTINGRTFTDDGSGWVGNIDPDHFQSGTIDYVTGSFCLVYSGSKTATDTLVMTDGTTCQFSGTLQGPVQPETIHIKADEMEAVDLPNEDGKTGVFTRDGCIGTINYVSGSYSASFPHNLREGKSMTIEYCNTPPPLGATATVSYKYAKGPGRKVAKITGNTLEAQWFVGDGTALPNCSNTVARTALQKAVGAAERWSAANGTDETLLLLPSGTIHFGDRLNRVYIRKGHFTLAGSGTLETCIAPWAGTGTAAQNKMVASRSITIDDTASHVELSNLKFDLQSNHIDFGNSVSSSADYFKAHNCVFDDSEAQTFGKTAAVVTGTISDWTSGTKGSTAVVQIACVTGTMDWVFSSTVTRNAAGVVTGTVAGTTLQIYDPSGNPMAYATVTGTNSNIFSITADKKPAIGIAIGDRLEFYETFTRHALESDGSNVTICDNTFQNTQLRISTGDALLSETILVASNTFLQSQAYSISCVGRSRCDKTDQIRKDITITKNTFTGFLRAAVYIGLDWGDAQYNGTVLDNINVTNNVFNITKAWRGEQVFRYHLGKINRGLSWSDNIITFVDRPVAAESCLHLINHASGNLRKGSFENNTVTSTFDTNPPGFEHTLWLEATDEFLIARNKISTGGDIYLWKGAQGVRVEDNRFTNAQQVLREDNAGRVSLVGNSIATADKFSAKMFTFSATGSNGLDVNIANNLISLSGTVTSDLTQISQADGHLSNISLLNNNVITGTLMRPLYSGTASVTYALPGVANWNFDEGCYQTAAGDGTTSSNQNLSGNDLALKNGATWGSDRAALQLDGIDDYALTASGTAVDLLGDFTLCAWICPSRIDGYRSIVSRVADANRYQYALSVKDGQLCFEQKNDSTHTAQYSGTLALVADQWHHVAVTSSTSSQTIAFYIDGSSAGVFSSSLTPVASSGTTLEVGRIGGGSPGSYYAGEIDDLQVYSNVLSQGNIQALAFGRGLGYWRMNEDRGNTIADESGLSNTGTAFGGYEWRDGVAGGSALRFDGSTAYVGVGPASNLDVKPPFSVTAWIYPEVSDTRNRTVVSKNIDDSHMLDLSVKNGQLVFVYGGTTSLSGPGGTANSWQHVAATVDSFGNAYLYCNGEIVASGTGFAPINTAAASLNIGKRVGSGSANFFQGNIDDVEIYNRSLWPDEVRTQATLP